MTLRVGVVGLGFMGRAHLSAYARLGARVIAVADPAHRDPSSGGNLAAGDDAGLAAAKAAVHHADAHDLFARGDIDLVSICTPTDTHIPLARAALQAGLHVVIEKPIATSSREVADLIETARAARRIAIPAMVMRTWPGWDWLAERARDRAHGGLRSLTLTRLGSPPGWSREFYADPARSGGAIFDLHIHDADFIFHLLGPPRAVLAAGTREHLTCLYRYEDATLRIAAEGGWVPAAGFPFRMRFTATFDRAVADWDLSRSAQLLLTANGQTSEVSLPANNPYDLEIARAVEHIERAAAGDPPPAVPTLAEAEFVTRMIEAEASSLSSSQWEPIK